MPNCGVPPAAEKETQKWRRQKRLLGFSALFNREGEVYVEDVL